jgi:very-short-patch-repair endonuclease
VRNSKHEAALEAALAVYGRDLPPFEREVAAIPGRKFRFDFAWLRERVAVEIQGGTFARGRSAHSGASIVRDHEKHNLATLEGWRVIYFNARDMTARALPATVETIRRVLRREAA